MPIENRLQDLANSLAQGAGMFLLRGFLFVCFTLGVFGFYAFSQFRGLNDAEAMELAQLARGLAENQGFTTRVLRPVELSAVRRPDNTSLAAPQPDLRHAPLFPAVLALGFKTLKPSFKITPDMRFFEPEIKVILPVSILVSIATGGLLLALGTRLFDRRIGFWAMVFYLITDSVLADSISGTALPLMTFLATAAVWVGLVVVDLRSRSEPWYLWCSPLAMTAGLCASAILTGYSLFVLVPMLATWVAAASERWRWTTVALFVAAVLIAIYPWLARNRQLSGKWLGLAPTAAVSHTTLYPEDSFERTLHPELNNFRFIRSLKLKLQSNALKLYDQDLRLLGSGLLVCFFLVSFFTRFENEHANSLRWCLLLGLLLFLTIAAAGEPHAARGLRCLLPLVVLYGTAFFFFLVQRTDFTDPATPLVLPWVMLALTAAPALVKAAGGPPRSAYPPYFPPFIAYVCDLLEPDEVICTDIPWATAWYGRRTSVLLPQSVADFMEIHQKYGKLSAIYLTSLTADKPYGRELVSGREHDWLEILDRRIPAGFPLAHGIDFPPGTRDQLFLTDRVRWPTSRPSGLAEDIIELRATAE